MKTSDYTRYAPCNPVQIVPAVSPWIMTVPVISTVHITKDDDILLNLDRPLHAGFFMP